MLEAFADFKRVYVEEGKKYGTFLQQAIDGHRCIAVDRDNVAASVSHLIVEYAKYASFLRKQRKLVIYHFTRMDSLSINTAEKLLGRRERRHELAPTQTAKVPISYPSVDVYGQFASLAQRYDIFVHPVSATMLMDFRDGNLSTPLAIRNVSRMVFFLKMMELCGIIVRISWKQLEESDMLVREDGQRINPGYMRRVASKLYPKTRIEAIVLKEKYDSHLDIYDGMAREALRIMAETERDKN